MLSALVALLVMLALWDRWDRWAHRDRPGPPERAVGMAHPVFRAVPDLPGQWGRGVLPELVANPVLRRTRTNGGIGTSREDWRAG